MVIVMLFVGMLAGAALVWALLARRGREAGECLVRAQAALDTERALRVAGEQAHGAQLEQAREQIRLVQAGRETLRDEMKAISSDVLRQTGETLSREMAAQRRADQERAAGEMARRQAELRGLVEPMGEKLARVHGEMERLERERREAQGQLGEMIRQLGDGLGALRRETGNLVGALKRPSTRGSWGEIQLRRVIEMAGMLAHCDFTEQTTIHTDDGRLRPDVLVRLPGGKLIVVDAKVPLDAYLACVEAASEEERELHAARHARQTRDHITKLASKGYQSQVAATPELVVMFVPSDGVYHAALAEDPALLEYGVEQHVLVATPMTLIALLRAVHFGWRQELIAESAREIADAGRELHKRMGRFAELFSKLGRQLDSAVDSYNEAVGSFDRRVVPQLRRIEDSGAAAGDSLDEVPAVEARARTLTAGFDGEPDPPAALPRARGAEAA